MCAQGSCPPPEVRTFLPYALCAQHRNYIVHEPGDLESEKEEEGMKAVYVQ